MEIIFDILFEVIAGLVVEGGTNKKVPKWIRYPLFALMVLFVVGLFVGLLVAGILFFIEGNVIIGVFFVLVGLFFLVALVNKALQMRKENKGETNEQ